MVKNILISLRPRQWTKNLIVFAGLIFTSNALNPDMLWRVLIVFIAFCLLSGGVYILNDLSDIEKDKHHPRKKNRPIASGALKPPIALTAAVLFLTTALALSFWISPMVLLVAAGFLALQFMYSVFLKNIVILDALTIAALFVLRALAGTESISVSMSPWLLIVTILLALFLALNKRRHELRILGNKAVAHRKVLKDYSTALLDQMTSVVASATIIAYSLYTFTSPTSHKAPYLMLTVPFVIYGVFRYEYLVFQDNRGGSPEETLLRDAPILVDVGLWVLSLFVVLYVTQ